MLKVEFRAMGTTMAAVLETESQPAARALQQVPGWFEEWEACLSRFRPESELNRLSARAGEKIAVSETLWQALHGALRAARFSDGLVTPAILPELEAAGYAQSFEQIKNRPTKDEERLFTSEGISAVRPAESRPLDAIVMDGRDRTVQLPEGMRLDFGGSAKGWAAQQAAQRLGAYGPALVDCGGDMAASGPLHSGRGWPVDIADPLNLDDSLGLLELPGGAVATSGIDRRRWRKNDAWQHHIIDPRTGRPADTDLLSVTVLAADGVAAEAAAKAVLLLGSEAGTEWLAAHPQVRGMLVLADGRVACGPGMQNYFWSEHVEPTYKPWG